MTQANPDDKPTSDTDDDPVLVRRRQAARLAATGKRVGYLLYLLAIVLFAAAMVTGLPRGLAVATVASLAIGSVFLAPSIVVAYGVKAADREDRERQAQPD